MDAAELTRAKVDYLARLRECRALQDRTEIAAATAIVESVGLPSHHDPQKNWDAFKCIAYVASLGDTTSPVLDAGAGDQAVALRWLHKLGYRDLYGCDIAAKPTKMIFTEIGAKVSKQELSATSYEAGFFQAITCISVIEHGVDLKRFAREMARILRPGGLLVLSTDYWSEPIDCTGIFPYGPDAPQMKILSPEDMQALAHYAASAGLELCAPLQLGTKDKAIRWERTDRDYTFIFAAFRKR